LKIMLWWDQKSLVYYELLKPGDSISTGRSISATIDLFKPCIAPEYEQRYNKVILLHDKAWPHVAKVVKKYLETLK